ncbi:MAG: response regulator transcription factor [Flavobacteriales bacterium]|tara:strand:+ start:311 stop:985 length:675 start_codon:yes stop_codon:yes gene_type:complete
MKNKILLIDDEKDILEFLSYNLIKAGYKIDQAENGDEGLKKLKTFKPDLIIVDVMMPVLDGIEFCSIVRSNPQHENIMIVFLTARSEDYTQIVALETGADDFISKPIKPKLLITKINSLIKRLENKKTENSILKFKNIELNIEKFQVLVDGEEKLFPKKEFEILEMLMKNISKVLTREKLLNTIWGTDLYVGDRTIDVHIKRIRNKVGSSIIKTIKGVGYKLSE